tara:strand:+ start:3227 stop:3970 length:744 start_codon:yes stop_codon:yes gene_type:complete
MTKQFLFFIFVSLSFSDNSTQINRIIKKTNKQYMLVNNFETTMNVSLNVPGFRMPKKSYKVYYKLPNKIKINTKGFGVLPKTGLFTSPSDNFDNLKNLSLDINKNSNNCILISGTVISDSLKAQFPNEYAKLTFVPIVDVVVDTTKWIIKSVTTRIDTVKLFEIKNNFQKFENKYYMPVKSQIEYYIKDAKLANWLNNDLGGIMKMGDSPEAANDVVQGTIKITYDKYKINKGIPDKVFSKRPDKDI